MRPIFYIFALLMSLLVSQPAQAGNGVCLDAFKRAKLPMLLDLDIKSIQPKLTYDYSKTRGELKRMSGKHSHFTNIFVNGLTIAEFQSSIAGQFTILDLNNGYSCVWPNKVIGEMGYNHMQVLIAKDFVVGSCEYNETLKHENEHVQINYRTFNKYLLLSKNKLNTFIKTQFPILVRSSNPDDAAISSINKQFYSIMKQMEMERDGLNNALDSPQNYDRIQKKCENW